MPINFTKIAGWLLLAIGLIVIFYSIFSSYNIFTAKTPAPMIFIPPAQTLQGGSGKTDQKIPAKGGTEQMSQDQMEQSVANALKGILPVEIIYQILNLVSWSIFASILFFGGSTISTLGIKLLKG